MTQLQLRLSKLNFPLMLLTLLLPRGGYAQTSNENSKGESETTDRGTASSSTPNNDDDVEDVDCEWDNSLGDYLSCNKKKFTTTQLVSAGIGVTLLIFILAFTALWLVRRRRKPVKSKKKNPGEEQVKAAGSESDSDERGDKYHHDEKREQVSERKSDVNGKAGPGNQRPISRVVTVQDESEDPSSQLQPHSLLTVPSHSKRSSRIGSPTEPPSTRQLYPSNPDPRHSMKPPTRPPRPASTVWMASKGQESQPPMPPPRHESRPPTSENLHPTDRRVPVNRSPSPSASRPVSSAPVAHLGGQQSSSNLHPNDKRGSVSRSPSPSAPRPVSSTPGTHPTSSLSSNDKRANITRSPSPSAQRPISSAPGTQPITHTTPQVVHQRPPPATRSASMHSTDTSRTDFNDMPLPVPPAQNTGNRPLPARSSSRASVGSNRQTSYIPSIPEQPVPAQRPVSVHPVARGHTGTPTPAPAPAAPPAPAPTAARPAGSFTAGIGIVRQSVSTHPNPPHARAASVSASVHEGDPSTARVVARKSMGPAAGKQATVEDEVVGQ